MVEKIELVESKGIDFDINGKIYNVNLSEFKTLVKYNKVIKKLEELKSKVDKGNFDIEKDMQEGIKILHEFINTVLNDENAVEDILGDKKENIYILFDLSIQLMNKTKLEKESLISERIKEYVPEK